MAEVDTSIYGNVPKQQDLLGTLSGVLGIQGQMNQNKLFQQQFNTNRALSDIYKHAIGPDGTLDPAKVREMAKSDPNITYGLPQAIQNSQEAQKRMMDIDAAQLDLARKNLTTAESYLSPLLAKPNVTSGDIVGVLSEAMTKGNLNQKMALELYGSLPRDPQGGIDETKIKPWLQQQQMRVMDAKQRFDAMFPAPVAVDTGANINLMRMPQVGDPSVAGVVEKGLPPTTPVFDASGQARFAGAGGGSSGGGMGGSGMLAAAPPGVPEAAAVDASAGAKAGVDLQTLADAVPTQQALLRDMRQKVEGFAPGPIAGQLKSIQSLWSQITGRPNEAVANQEEFNKSAELSLQQDFKALGGTGTDQQLGSAFRSNPNEALSKMGIKGIISLKMGLNDAIAAKNQAWQEYKAKNGPQSYGKFSTEFNKTYDPRAFQMQHMTPDERAKMLKSLSKDEQARFLKSYRTALENGWVSLPGGK